MPAAILEKWKEILAAVAGILVILLQIINTFLSSDIDGTLRTKMQQITEIDRTILSKTDTLQDLLAKQREISSKNALLLDQNSKSAQEGFSALTNLIDGTPEKLAGLQRTEEQLMQLLQRLESSPPTPKPTPQK